MNMHCVSRLGWIRSSKEASPHAPGEVPDPAQAGSATSGRAPAGARAALRTFNRSRAATYRGVPLLAAAALLLILIPGLAFADVPVATLSGPAVAVEGSDATTPTQVPYTVTLTGATGSATIEIKYTVTGTATEGVDYTKPAGKVEISAGDSEATFMIDILHDEVEEVGETLVVTLTAATTEAGTVAIGSPDHVTTMVRSSDTVLVSVAEGAVEENAQDAAVPFEVTVTVPSGVTIDSGDVTIGYKILAGTATAGVDFTAPEPGATVDLGTGNPPTGTISVPVLGDTLAENDETFTVMLILVRAPDNVAFGRSTAKGTITDDDTLTVTVESDQRSSATDPGTLIEGSAATFTVTLGGGTSTEDVVVSYTVSDGSVDGEVDKTDYETSSGTVTIPAGNAKGTITIQTLADDKLEDEEPLKVTLTGATTEAGTITPPNATARVNVVDRGRMVTVSIEDVAVNEGDHAVFTVELSGKVGVPVELSLGFDGTASSTAPNVDYRSSAEPVIIETAERVATFTAETLLDDQVEGPETLRATLTLVSPDDATLVRLGKAFGTATINDANVLTATLTGPNTVPEGTPAIYTVKLDGGSSTGPVEIDYGVTGTGVEGADYEAPTGSLEIAVGESLGYITVHTIADQQAGETLVMTLNGATTSKGTASVGRPNRVETTTTAQDTVTVSVAAMDGELTEGTGEEFTVTLAGGEHSEAVRVNYTVGGDVTNDDYDEDPRGTLTIATGDRSETLTLTAKADMLEEPEETITVTISLPNQTVDAAVGTPTAKATIAKNDPLTVAIAADQERWTEGSTATFTVTLSGGKSTANVVVSYEVDGDVADYSGGTTGRLTIPAGVQSGTITIPTVDDGASELAEELTVKLTRATIDGRSVALSPDAQEDSTTIEASDGTVLVSVDDAGTVDEGEDAVFTVNLSGQVSEDLVVGYQTVAGTATSDDYTATPSGMVTISAGKMSATFTVETTPDLAAETAETFTVELADTDLLAGVRIDTESATATIRDDEELKVSITASQQTVNLNGPATFTITVTGGTITKPVMVDYREGGTTETATITTGTSTPVTIATTGRAKNTTVVVELTGARTSAGSVSVDRSNNAHRATTRIIDSNDDKVAVSASPESVEEGAQSPTAEFTVSIAQTQTTQIRVSYSVGGSATRGRDYTGPSSGTLTIPAGELEATGTITVTVLDDDLAEDAETIEVTLSGSLPDDVTFDPSTATVTIPANDTLAARVKRQGPTVVEGQTTTYTVELTLEGVTPVTPGAGSEDVVISYTMGDSTATEEDFTAPSGKLTIRAEQTEGAIAIRTLADEVLETGETLVVELKPDTEPPARMATTAAGMVTLPVTEVQTRTTTIADRQGTVLVSVDDAGTVDEGEDAVFTVNLSGQVSEDLVVGYQTVAGTATSDDYTATPSGMVTISAGKMSATFTVETTPDLAAETAETFTVELADTDLLAGVRIDTESATATIRDDEELKVSITASQQTVNLNGPATFTITVTGGTITKPVMVDYREGGTTETATITTGTSTPVTIATTGRAKNTTVVVELTGARTSAGSVSVDRSNNAHRATTRIIDSNDDKVAVSASPESVEEGAQSPTAEFTVSIAQTQTTQIRVSYSVGGSATRGRDYTGPSSGTLTIPAGELEATGTITVTVLDDDLAEDAETIEVTLSGSLPDDVTFDPSTATVTIPANDTLAARVKRQGPTVVEGQTTTYTVELTLEGVTPVTPGAGSEDVVISYTMGDSTATEEDFTAPSGKLTIRAEQTEGAIAIRTLADEVLETGETLVVELKPDTEPPARMATTAAGMVTLPVTEVQTRTTTIADRQGTVLVSVDDATADEGETAMFAVELSGAVDDNVVVTYNVTNGTGIFVAMGGAAPCAENNADKDYLTPTDRTVTIAKGDTMGTIPVQTCDDTVAEASETFAVTLTGVEVRDSSDRVVAEAAVSLGDAAATGTITDDALTATVVGPTEVEEGSEAEYTVTVTGGGVDNEDVTVRFTTENSTATAGVDFSPGSGSVTIPTDEGMATFTIQILEDEEADLGETLELSVEAETADGDVRAIPPAPATIVDDDGSVDVSIMAEQPKVAEGESAAFIVELSGTVSNADVILPYTVGGPGDTAAAEDYTAGDLTISIPAGQMAATISVALRADGQDELDETLSVSLQAEGLPEGVEIGTGTARVTITDYELTASVTGPVSVVEGESATFTVELASGANRSDALVRYTWTAGTAQAPGDFDAPSGTLTIPEGQTSGTVTIVTKADGVLDPSETLVLTLTETGALGTGLVVVDSTADSASTTIADEGSVTWSVSDASVEEGDEAVFTVTLSDLVQDDVTLTYSTQDGTAVAQSDYIAAVRQTVTVSGGSSSGRFTVETRDDDAGEATESFTVDLTLSSAPSGVGPPSATATATIRDDDITLEAVPPVTITEGETEDIVLRLEQPLRAVVKVRYTPMPGTTASAEDFSAALPVPADAQGAYTLPVPADAQGAYTLPVGFQTGAIAMTAVDDSLAEGTEQLVLALLTVPASGQPVTLGTISITIEDNDTLSAGVTAPETVAEGEVAPFKVTLRGGTSTAPVVVTYTMGGTAKAPGDYTAPGGSLTMASGEESGTISIQTNIDNVIEPDETLIVTLTNVETANGVARVGSPKSATTAIQDEAFHSFNRVNQTLLPGVVRASAASALEAVGWRMAEAAQGDPPAPASDLSGLTRLYRALQANEYALQDGSYDLAQVLGGSSFLIPLSSHDGDADAGVGFAVWGGGDFRSIGGGTEDAVDWDGSVWSARLGADMRFVDSLLTGIAVSWASGALDYVDATPRDDREGTYATWLVSAHPYVGWTTPDFGLWASGGFGFGGVTLDDSEADAEEADLTQWSVGAGGSVTLLSTDWFIAGGTTAVKLKAEGFLAGATVAENESKLIQELSVGVNQARAAIEASHAQHFAGGGSLRPALEIGGRFDGGDGETGAGMEVGGGLTYADPGLGLTVAATGRALVVRDGDYGEWGLSGLFQWDPNAAGHGLMMSVRPTFGVTASGVSGLWEHGTLDLLSGGDAAGGRVEAEIGYGLSAFGTAGVLTPYAGASLTDAGAHSLSLGGRLELGPAFDLTLELERSENADPATAAEHDLTLEGSFSW